MPRILSDAPCTVTFSDNITGDKITLSYRQPTTEERIKYTNSYVNRRGRKIESAIGETRMKYGRKILVGITDGDFCKADKTPLSSNPGSPGYDSNWKEIVAQYAPDIIAMLSVQVFENSLEREEPEAEGEGSELEDPT